MARVAGLRLAPLFLLAGLLCMPSASAEEADADWPALFASLDADGAYEAIQEVVRKKDFGAAERLFEAGLRARHMHLAIEVGSALQKLGGPWMASGAFEAALAAAAEDPDPARRVNLARILGALDTGRSGSALAAMALRQKDERVAVEALLMSGSLTRSSERSLPAVQMALAKALKSKRAGIRRAAATAIGRARFGGHGKTLLKLARGDEDRWVSMRAVRALERLGHDGGIKSFASSVARKDDHSARHAWLKAIVCLARAEDLPSILSLLKHRHEDARMAGVLATLRIVRPAEYAGTTGAAATADMLTADQRKALVTRLLRIVFGEEELARTRSAACFALTLLRDGATGLVAAAARKRLKAREGLSFMYAARLCGEYQVPEAFEALLKTCLVGKNAANRMWAARALESVDAERTLAELASSLSAGSTKKSRRLAALEALGYIRRARALELLIRRLSSKGAGGPTVVAAQRSLERLTGHAFGPDPETWRAYVASRKRPFRRDAHRVDRSGQRASILASESHGYKPATEGVLQRGLQFLERWQDPHGLWFAHESGFGGPKDGYSTMTTYCVLAFCGAGCRPDQGRYRETLWRAAEYLASTQHFDGTPSVPQSALEESVERRSRVEPPGTRAFLESWLAGHAPAFRPPAQRALDFVRFDNPGPLTGLGGSVPGIVANLASAPDLLLARGAGLLGDPTWAVDLTEAFLARRTPDVLDVSEALADVSRDLSLDVGAGQKHLAFTLTENIGEKRRSNRDDPRDDTISAIGAWSRLGMGVDRAHPFLVGSANYLALHPPEQMYTKPGTDHGYKYEDWAMSSLVMFQMGGRYWRTWSNQLQAVLSKRQVRAPPARHGSWELPYCSVSTIESTAIALISLETFYRYPPWCADAR